MGRSKINMEFIQDHKNRRSTLQRRKAGLVKKISELSILCDIKACMIIYEGNNQVQEIWPNDLNKVQELINLYKNQSLEGRSKRAKSLSSFFEYQKKKAEIKEEKYPTWDSRFDNLSEEELRNLAGVLEKKIENVKGKVEFLKHTNVQDSTESSLSHQELWDYPELMNNNFNQTTPCPISPFIDNSNFFQEFTSDFQANPSGVNSVGMGMDNELLTVGDYQFGNADSMKTQEENWLASNGIGSSFNNAAYGVPFLFNGSTHMPYGFEF